MATLGSCPGGPTSIGAHAKVIYIVYSMFLLLKH